MDNITHSLFGVALAEGAYQLALRKNKKQKISRTPFYFCSILANNFPDLDLIMNVLDPTPLGYLVHHRGHTHTLLWALPQALIVYLISSWRKNNKFVLAILSLAGVCAHMFLDYQNSYGIHFLSPLDNRWLYGDTLFIVEPMLWLPIIALAILNWQSWQTKSALIIVVLAIEALGFYLGLATITSISVLLAWFAACYLFLLKASELQRIALSLILFLSVIGFFKLQQLQVERHLAFTLKQQNVSGVVDTVLSPAPSHPFCWSIFVVSHIDDSYRVDVGTYGLNCPSWKRLADLSMPASELSPTAYLQWLGTYRSSVKSLTANYADDCRISSWFQFVRVPVRKDDLLTDLRFGSERNFSALDLKNNIECPRITTLWTPPRLDLIEASHKP